MFVQIADKEELPLTRIIPSAVLLIVTLFLANGVASAQTPKGFDIKVLGSIDLGPEIEGMAGRVLRMSYVTVAPGGGLAAHSHDGRPEIIYVVQGILTEERNGGPAIDHKAGDVLVMKTGITHALSNRSAEPAVFISAPIAKQ
jgi:quercetin dioxygenase-like cupin family protein